MYLCSHSICDINLSPSNIREKPMTPPRTVTTFKLSSTNCFDLESRVSYCIRFLWLWWQLLGVRTLVLRVPLSAGMNGEHRSPTSRTPDAHDLRHRAPLVFKSPLVCKRAARGRNQNASLDAEACAADRLFSRFGPRNTICVTLKWQMGMFLATKEESAQNHDTQHQDQGPMHFTDIDNLAWEYEDFPMNQTLKFPDVWAKRLTSGMSNLEKGIATHWSFGRVILVGDACHKFTPNAGLGLNSSVPEVMMPRVGKSRLTSRHSKAPTPAYQHKSVGIDLLPEYWHPERNRTCRKR
ncbi:hypothetical protein BGZ61DRAFT_476791 [Ilyonectria robusta]|uniref:uncharacterized protein n=1 Tax=Ilyonectria robusta TaxID=1079257 RepID=UPI001E8D90B7|nr:uncharacterized protein BGZ61DRAFT_476791 [Ilyonectria robusta]KAH8714744.1 hypothetical protein BGZ61DRAFT_476791 [Ilyonectria robusta]